VKVLELSESLERDFFLNPKLLEARRKNLTARALEHGVSLLVGIGIGLALGLLVWWIRDYGAGFMVGALSSLSAWLLLQFAAVKKFFSRFVVPEARPIVSDVSQPAAHRGEEHQE
jgi:hypothetical protein